MDNENSVEGNRISGFLNIQHLFNSSTDINQKMLHQWRKNLVLRIGIKSASMIWQDNQTYFCNDLLKKKNRTTKITINKIV